MTDWHYSPDGKERRGPVSDSDFQQMVTSGQIRPDMMVWREGMADWAPQGQVQASMAQPPAGEPATGEMAVCAVSGKAFPKAQLLAYGDQYVSAEHKDAFVQSLQEGESLSPQPAGGATRLRNTVMRSRVLQGFLWAYLVCDVLILSMGAIDYMRISQGEFPILSENSDKLTALEVFYLLVGLLTIPAFLGTVIAFCMWIHRMAWNAHSLSSAPLQISPGWAVGWYFIPFANLVKPYQSMVEIYKASKQPENWEKLATPGLIVGWWFFWIISNILSNVEMRMTNFWDEGSIGTGMALFAMFTSGMSIIATILALRLVGSLFALQRKHAGR